jgi:hypothetical protein
LYLLAGLLLLGAIAPHIRSWWFLAATFAIFVFNPAQYGDAELRLVRAGLYTPLTLTILALIFWWIRLRTHSWRHRLPVALGLGLTLGCFWITREEGIWIAPILASAAGFLLLPRRRQTIPWRRMIAREMSYIIIAAIAAVAPTQIVASINDVKYGVHDVVEFRQSEFLDAYASLSRIKHTEWRRRIVAPREARARAYAVSPTFRELKPYLDGARGEGWANTSCQNSKPDPCFGEIGGGWFVYALRQAAAFAGHHRSASKARTFYARMALELNTACDDGRLECSAHRQSMAPPFRTHYLADTAARIWDTIQMLTTLDRLKVAAGRSTGPRVDIDIVSELIGVTPFPRDRALIFRGDVSAAGATITAILMDGVVDNWRRTEIDERNITVSGANTSRVRFDLRTSCLNPTCNLVVMGAQGELARVNLLKLTEQIQQNGVTIRLTKVMSPQTFRPGADRTARTISILRAVTAAYATVLPYLSLIAVAVFTLSILDAIWRRRLAPLVLINAILFITIATRVTLLSYVDISAFPAINTIYLSPVYPVLLLFCAFVLIDGIRLAASFRATWFARSS